MRVPSMNGERPAMERSHMGDRFSESIASPRMGPGSGGLEWVNTSQCSGRTFYDVRVWCTWE